MILLASDELSQIELRVPPLNHLQTTIAKSVTAEDIGLFTGVKVKMTLLPAPVNSGILIQRMDLPSYPFIPVSAYNVKHASRCTLLAHGTATVQTVEHLLSALHAFQIDNVIVQLYGPEIPIFDGSSNEFVALLEEAGQSVLEEEAQYIELTTPMSFSNGDALIIALPSDTFQISYTLCYPNSPLIGTQFYSCVVSKEFYKTEIAPARTFSNYEEVVPLIEKGYIKGGNLNNAVVIQGDKVLNPGGVRFSNEMVRHKVLDLIGDLSLVGKRIKAHFVAIKTGHAENAQLARMILDKFNLGLMG